MRRILLAVAVLIVVVAGWLAYVLLRLELPAPTGPHAVGRMGLNWTDEARPEVITADANDRREIAVQIWYPAAPVTGEPDAYFPGLDAVRDALLSDEELSTAEAYLLPLVRVSRMKDAELLPQDAPYPVLILSPGYSTNVEFYAVFAEDLASHGYVVVGINHSYDVGAVALSDGRVAALTEGDPVDMEQRHAWMVERAAVRVADVSFVLDRLTALNGEEGGKFKDKLDLSRAGILGHSVGGVTAAEACRADARLKGVINMDGVQLGGIISVAEPAPPPADRPFMFVSDDDPLWPKAKDQLSNAPAGAWHLTVHGSRHSHFSDEEALLAQVLPLPNKADKMLAITREYVLAFFDQVLLEKGSLLLEEATSNASLTLDIYPKKN